MKEKFVWDNDKEDQELRLHGVTLIIATGRAKAIQNFVEKLSYKINSKCDFAFTAGRAHIDVSKDALNKAIDAINDEEFMNQFIVPYSEETFDNETYFQVYNI
nr:MAG TPA: hypothetical protein [Herelleviridae sp.]